LEGTKVLITSGAEFWPVSSGEFHFGSMKITIKSSFHALRPMRKKRAGKVVFRTKSCTSIPSIKVLPLRFVYWLNHMACLMLEYPPKTTCVRLDKSSLGEG